MELSQVVNYCVTGLILAWSMLIFYRRPNWLYGAGSDSRVRTFNFWLAFWFATLLLYLVHSFTLVPDDEDSSMLKAAFRLATSDVNSILLLGTYLSYVRGREFRLNRFIRTWLPLLGILISYEFVLAAIGQSSSSNISPWNDVTLVPLMMATPSLGLSMIAGCALGWAFYRRLGSAATVFPVVSVPWALLQIPLYFYFNIVKRPEIGFAIMWLLIILKLLVAVMFFAFIAYPVTSDESLIRPSQGVLVWPAMKKVAKYFLYSAGSILALVQLGMIVYSLAK